MPNELRLPLDGVLGFVLVLSRVAGALSFVRIPGAKNTPTVAKVALALSLTFTLLPVWPRIPIDQAEAGLFAFWMLCDLTFGVAVGLAVSFLNEAFVLASQIFGLQAGYGYASTIDPATQADSSVLQIFAHLAAGLMFFSFGLHRAVIRVFARSLEVYPPGSYSPTIASAQQVLELGTEMFAVAVRLALPVVALLMLIDISLALLGRVNAQMQLLTLAFPTKMLVSMGLLAAIAVLLPRLYQSIAEPVLHHLNALVAPVG